MAGQSAGGSNARRVARTRARREKLQQQLGELWCHACKGEHEYDKHEKALGYVRKWRAKHKKPSAASPPIMYQATDPLLEHINSLLASNLPQNIREDASQELALMVLDGQITQEEIPTVMKQVVGRMWGPWAERGGQRALYLLAEGITDDCD